MVASVDQGCDRLMVHRINQSDPSTWATGEVVLVTGGRLFDDREFLFSVFDVLHALSPIRVLVHGAQRGADKMAGAWACARGVTEFEFPAQWNLHGQAAGPLRNTRMRNVSMPDVGVAFSGRYGTRDMVRKLLSANIPVLDFRGLDGMGPFPGWVP